MISDPTLWAHIDALDLDDPTACVTFSDRLARDNGWSPPFARRVVAEYKRFVYLSQVAGRTVTPSDAVDQAWHLHLTHTRHYWEALCECVLGRPLHHDPTRGGAAEDARYRDCYEHTRAAYAREFDEAPPADIWPGTEARFAAAGFRRIDTAGAWIVPRPLWLARLCRRLGRTVGVCLAALGLLVAGASVALAAGGSESFGEVALIAIGGGLVLIFAVGLARGGDGRNRRRKRKGNARDASGCSSGCGSSGCGGGSCGGGD